MAEDWDLYAVVRGCKSATATTTTTTNTTTCRDASLSSLATLSFKEENDPFSFPTLIQPRTNGFHELHQLFIPFIPTTTVTTSGCSTYPNSPFSDFAGAGSIGQHHHPVLPASYTSIRPHFIPEASTSGFERFHDQKQQQQHVQQLQQQQKQNQLQVVQQQQFQVAQSSNSAIPLPNTQAQTPRSRKRKSQQKKMVCQVTAENLSSDLWAWRKYGQKPIKGSPYPRNYYRCSSSKGCAARKQVERSTTEPDTFIITYTGDHTHPRPTHRNSLAGSVRNKPSTAHKPATHGSGSLNNNIANRASSLSPLSPTTPLIASPENEEGADDSVSTNEATSPDLENEMDMASDDEILIPNMAAVVENIFLGVHQFGNSGEAGSRGDNPADGSSPKVNLG